jgi:hypothetical protein
MPLPLVAPCSECHSRFCTKACPDGYCVTYRRPRATVATQPAAAAFDGPAADKMLRRPAAKKSAFQSTPGIAPGA